jgi:acyl-CoA reductase-like NAD-dependent aldehyde dehydrogenase
MAADCFVNQRSGLPPFRRIEILKRLAALVEREAEAFALLIAREGGKPLMDARVEVIRAISGIEGAIGDLSHLTGTEVPMGLTPTSSNRWAFTTREPIGVVVAISAFNHPLNLVVHQVIPAIAAGCPVIVKPSPVTPLTCLLFLSLVREAGLFEPWCQVAILDDNYLAEILATDSRVAFLSFIGSAKVGWHLRSKLPAGTRCALEHGGAAPVLVDSSANLDSIIEPLLKGSYYHAGQVCVSTQRIYVHKDLKTDFVDRFVERVGALRVGDPTSGEVDVGPLISSREVDRIDRWVRLAVEAGGKLVIGGRRLADCVYQPTVIVEPPPTACVSQKEIFGPVTCIYGYSKTAEAITRANSVAFAFQASIFSRDIHIALEAARLLDASSVMINDHSAFRTDWMPFSGRRQSGYGTGGIPYTMKEMTQEKMIVFRL